MILNKLYLILGIFFIVFGVFLIIFSLGLQKNSKFTLIGLIGPFPIIITNDEIPYTIILAIILLLISIFILFLFFFY